MKNTNIKYKVILAVTIILICFFGWSNAFWVQSGSNTDDPILDKENKFVRMENDVLDSDIDLSNGMHMYIKVPRVDKDNLFGLIQLCDSAKKYFSNKGIEVGISSLSTTVDYANEDLDMFVSKKRLMEEDFDDWYSKVSIRNEVQGKLMGRIEGEYDYYIVSLLPPQSYSENEMYRYVKEWLEGKETAPWQLYFDPEIEINLSVFEVKIDGEKKSVNMEIDLIGWSVGRMVINAVSHSESFKRIIPAIALFSFVILILKLGSFRQSITSLMVVILATIFTRGAIGLYAQLFSSNFKEDVFTVLVYVVCLIPGFSFSMRRFEEFNDADRGLSFWKRWHVADKEGFVSMSLIAFISIIDFLIFMSFTNRLGSRSIFQIGILCATGIFFAWLLAKYFQPALHSVIGGEKRSSNGNDNNKIAIIFGNIIETVNLSVFKCSKSIFKIVCKKNVSIVCASTLIVLIALTVTMIRQGYLKVESDPAEFLKNTILSDVEQEMKKDGRPGFNTHQIYITPKSGTDINDPAFIDQLWGYSKVVSNKSQRLFTIFDYFLSILEHDYPEHYNIGVSPKDAIMRIAEEAIKEGLNAEESVLTVSKNEIKVEAREIINGIWNDIKDNSDKNVIKHFLSQNAILMFATDEDTTSNGLAQFRDNLLSTSDNYSHLDVKTPGKLALYPEVDNSITSGSMINAILSQIMIGVICGAWIAWRNRRYKGEWKLSPVRTGILMSTPFVFSTCLIFLFMIAFNIPLDIATSSIGAISVSVAVDLPIFFVGAFHPLVFSQNSFSNVMSSKKMVNEGGKIFADFAINAPGFLLLTLSLFPTVFRIGYLMVIVLVACTFGTVLIMAPMMRWSIVKAK